jgi:pimeloyl-ACP methyl ester carboxylesterase
VCYDKDEQIGIIALELMPISSRITFQASDKDVLVNEVHMILNYHGWKKCILVGHSYGTVISAHLLKSPQTAHLIGPIMLIDPIPFLLHLPDVAYNFTARSPTRAMELVLWYFASMDLGIAHTLGRRFFWAENVLWKEDLWRNDVPECGYRDITVVLSGKDDIVNVHAVRRYLTDSNETVDGMDDLSWQGHGLDVIWFDKLHHAQVFDYRSTRGYLVKFIRSYSELGFTLNDMR